MLSVPIYASDTNTAVASSDSLVSGLAYYVKVDDILTALAAKGITIIESGTPIYVTATTTVRGIELSKTELVTLRKLVLFDLG